MYSKRLEQNSLKLSGLVHSKDLKSRILSNIPGLKAYKKGRHASLAFDEDVEIALKIVSENSVMAKPIF